MKYLRAFVRGYMKYLRSFPRRDRWPSPRRPNHKTSGSILVTDPEWGWMTKQKFNINFSKLCDTFLDVEPGLFTATLFVQLYWELLLRKLLHYRHFCACVSWKWKGSRHFRVKPGLCIKTRLSAQPLIWRRSRFFLRGKGRGVCTQASHKPGIK